jgi:hypothetical protein
MRTRIRQRCAGSVGLSLLTAAMWLGAILAPGVAPAQCVVVRERGGPMYASHLALHFGDAEDVPSNLQCATSLDKDLPSLCVPIYAYHLWEGADTFEIALRTPGPPAGFDRGPSIMGVEMSVRQEAGSAVTSLRLTSPAPVCGPALLGCLRLPTATLPDDFKIEVVEHRGTGRRAARGAGGTWHPFSIDAGGARVGIAAACPSNACGSNTPIRDLRAVPGGRPGMIDVSWRNGSGSFTLLRYRADGRFPADPWDGDFLAFLPSSVTRSTHLLGVPGNVRIAAWSVTRGPFGQLFAVSDLECGALATVFVHLPVAAAPRTWGQVKTLYR